MSDTEIRTSKESAAPIHFARSSLGQYRHVCAFFNSPQEEYETLVPFVRAGLEQGERAYHVLPAKYVQEHLDQLRNAGIDVDAARQTRQLEIALPEDTYLRGGCFGKDGMLVLIQEALKAGPALGLVLTRLIAHAETVLEDWANVNDWVEYETRLNDVLPSYDDVVICTYDANLPNGISHSISCVLTPQRLSAACCTKTPFTRARRSCCVRFSAVKARCHRPIEHSTGSAVPRLPASGRICRSAARASWSHVCAQ